MGSVVGMDCGMYRTCVRQRRVARGVDDNTDRRVRPRDPRVTRSFDERRGVVCRLLFVVCRLLFVVCCLLFVVCRLSFIKVSTKIRQSLFV